MIQAAISHLASQLNQFMKRTYGLTEDIVVVSHLVEADGTVAPHVSNKLVLMLTNLEKDTVPHRIGSRLTGGDGRGLQSSTPIYLNLYVMLAANFNGANYGEALKFISNAITYFQRQPVFDRQVSPDLDTRIEKLVLDIENLNVQDLSNLWGVLGGKYLPSVYYRVRMVAFNGDDVIGQLPFISRPDADVQ